MARNGLGKVEDRCIHNTGIEHLCPVQLSPACQQIFPAFLSGERKGVNIAAFQLSPPSPPCPTWNINVGERGLSPHMPMSRNALRPQEVDGVSPRSTWQRLESVR